MSTTVCVDAEGALRGALVQHAGFDPEMTVAISVNQLNGGSEELLSRSIFFSFPSSKFPFQKFPLRKVNINVLPAGNRKENPLFCSDYP